MPYSGAVTADENEPGINGAFMQRQDPLLQPNQRMNVYACTLGVDDYVSRK